MKIFSAETKIVFACIFWLMFSAVVMAQPAVKLRGQVLDDHNHPLPGATVVINHGQFGTVTNRSGQFEFPAFSQSWLVVEVSYTGYEKYTDTLHFAIREFLKIKLTPATHLLDELQVTDKKNGKESTATSALISVSKDFMKRNENGSLMQTLSRLPGISTISIGSGQSKPVIRGLGFNRVTVAENGLKHEGQEWGADHGLEIDQNGVERIEIVKGPASLMYGAGAIAGVIDLKQLAIPYRHSHGGKVDLGYGSNSDRLGAAASYFARADNFYIKTKFSTAHYADYKVPADSIEYMSYYFKLKNNRLRNTAGYEYNGSATAGYVGYNFASHLTVSNVFAKSGFFANAHGLEIRTSDIDYDASSRDIDFPSQQVNHFKVMSNSNLKAGKHFLHLDLGYQRNVRSEFSEAIAHGYMPAPDNNLERHFDKSTFSGQMKFTMAETGKHQFVGGISGEYQHNIRGGWGFILPDYQSFTTGAFVTDKIVFSEKWHVNAGLRYDFGQLQTGDYTDWYESKVDGQQKFLQRAFSLTRNYHNLSWAVGTMLKASEELTLKINTGKSFRMPNAKELASNGMNYHYYRYEKGDTTLRAETSYQLDAGLDWETKKLTVAFSPFVNYFPNYIYLNPGSEYFMAQQVFYHSQSQIFRTGAELSVNYRATEKLEFLADAEYIYSLQLSGAKKGYTHPFSPSANMHFGVIYKAKENKIWGKPEAGLTLQLTAQQHNVVPPEKSTEGFALLHAHLSTEVKYARRILKFQLRVDNILNTKYYDHTSFYRLIEVPGPGRNFTANLQIPL